MQVPSAEISANQIVEVIHSIAREAMPVGARLGFVVSPPPDIKVAVDNIILDAKDLYIDAFLLTGYQRETSGETTLTNVAGSLIMEGISGSLSVSGTTSE